MEYLIRFIQMHESFRQAETNALAELNGFEIQWISYSEETPFALIRFSDAVEPHEAAKALMSRSILTIAIYELWGEGIDYAALHEDVHRRTSHLWDAYRHQSFRFELDSFHGSRSLSQQRDIIETFSYMDFRGPIVMKNADNHFTVFEDSVLNGGTPWRFLLGRLVAESGRKVINKYNLKKRRYISTTSMDAELSLVTANLALAAPGKLAYDPFMGTGSFPVACAHFGSVVFGSDMDGRSIRGKKGRNVKSNFEQYGTSSLYLDGFAADLTNTPLRVERCLDAILCDPPYGIREGLKVLGSVKLALQEEVILADGTPAHLRNDYVPPRKPYSFLRMIDDILDFSATTLVDDGRLCMWMPVAGNAHEFDELLSEDIEAGVESEPNVEDAENNGREEAEYAIPQHPALKLVSCCTQAFNKWSRRLLTYRRLNEKEIDHDVLRTYRMLRTQSEQVTTNGQKIAADELNSFRKQYFQGFKAPS